MKTVPGKIDIQVDTENNSIHFEDDFADQDLYFYPDVKRYERHFKIKDDAFFSTRIFEYKVSNNPIKISVKLIESFTEPPLQYEVKDGVVQEADLSKNDILDRIKDLKEEVKWKDFSLDNDLLVHCFILSLHQDIIPKDDFRKYLRSFEESIKLGLSKVETALKSDSTGLKILQNEYNQTQIWYQDTEKIDDHELNRRAEYVKKEYYSKLFDANSKNYSGLTPDQFSNSSILLTRITEILDSDLFKPKKSGIGSPLVKISKQNSIWGATFLVALVSFVIIAFFSNISTAVMVSLLIAIIYALYRVSQD